MSSRNWFHGKIPSAPAATIDPLLGVGRLATDSSTKPKVYVDSCVVSQFADGRGRADDVAAVAEIMCAYETGLIEVVKSSIVDREVGRVREPYKPLHLQALALVANVPLVAFRIKTPPINPMSFPFGEREHELLSKLKSVLPDTTDAEHVFQAAMSNFDYLVTVDHATMVKHASKVASFCRVRIVTPAEFLTVLAEL